MCLFGQISPPAFLMPLVVARPSSREDFYVRSDVQAVLRKENRLKTNLNIAFPCDSTDSECGPSTKYLTTLLLHPFSHDANEKAQTLLCNVNID